MFKKPEGYKNINSTQFIIVKPKPDNNDDKNKS